MIMWDKLTSLMSQVSLGCVLKKGRGCP
uniref:Uncharacterized protein n=1 Tax=Arundo donax TaxID=35708 RepID=A0A0A9B050_ARUDO